MELPNGKPRPFTPENVSGEGAAVSPDGKLMALAGSDVPAVIYPVDGGESRPIAGLEAKEVPIQWSADGGSLYVTRFGELPMKVLRLDLATGRREPWKELAPAERAGFIRIAGLSLTRDGQSYAYSYSRVLTSDLYLVSGLK
jgi:hypothetical protein